MNQSDLPSNTNLQAPEDVKPVHRAYASLMKEVPANSPAWLSADKHILTAQALQAEVENSSTDGRAFAEAVLAQVMKFICEKNRNLLKRSTLRLVDVSPREHIVAVFSAMQPDYVVWKTMSKYFPAGEMAQLLRDGEPDGMQYASDLLRVSRDVVMRRSLMNA